MMKNPLSAALDRDPLDSMNAAELLAIVLRHLSDMIQPRALTAMAIKRAIKRRLEAPLKFFRPLLTEREISQQQWTPCV